MQHSLSEEHVLLYATPVTPSPPLPSLLSQVTLCVCAAVEAIEGSDAPTHSSSEVRVSWRERGPKAGVDTRQWKFGILNKCTVG